MIVTTQEIGCNGFNNHGLEGFFAIGGNSRPDLLFADITERQAQITETAFGSLIKILN